MGCENAEMSFRMVGGCIEGEKRGLQGGEVMRRVTKRVEETENGM